MWPFLCVGCWTSCLYPQVCNSDRKSRLELSLGISIWKLISPHRMASCGLEEILIKYSENSFRKFGIQLPNGSGLSTEQMSAVYPFNVARASIHSKVWYFLLLWSLSLICDLRKKATSPPYLFGLGMCTKSYPSGLRAAIAESSSCLPSHFLSIEICLRFEKFIPC